MCHKTTFIHSVFFKIVTNQLFSSLLSAFCMIHELICICKQMHSYNSLICFLIFILDWLLSNFSQLGAIDNCFLLNLTHYQPTNFRLFWIERLCRRQFQIWWKWQKVIQTGRKHWEKEKLLITGNFSFSNSVFKRLVSQWRQKVSLWEWVKQYSGCNISEFKG